MNKAIANAWAQDKEQRAKDEVSKKEISDAFNKLTNKPNFTKGDINQIWNWVNKKNIK
tara:strand:- start:396 stop:569 length:174 start_codon:yes stop_codon:yes gene_type:complete